MSRQVYRHRISVIITLIIGGVLLLALPLLIHRWSEVHREPLSSVIVPPAVAHPRLCFSKTEIPLLRTQAATTHTSIWSPVDAYTAKQLGRDIPVTPPPGADLDAYRDFGNELIALAFACVINNDEAQCAFAQSHLRAYATWPTWEDGETSGLGFSHMLMGNAIAYDWLYDRLTPSERVVVATSLGDRAQRLYEMSMDGTAWWHQSPLQNFYFTTHSALGMAALALWDVDPRADEWLELTINKLIIGRDFLNGIGDGSWHESIPYQNYALEMALPFWVSLRRITGIDLLPHEYLRNYAMWRLYNYLPDSDQFILAFGDFEWLWLGVDNSLLLLRFCANEYRIGHAEWLAQQLIDANPRTMGVWSVPRYVFEFLFYEPSVVAQLPNGLPTAHTFPDLEGVIWRTGWSEHDLVFALKSGPLGGRFAAETFVTGTAPWPPNCFDYGCQLNAGHDHDDSNGFYLFANGEWLAPEVIGVANSATSLHNTLLIDGQGQYRPPETRYWEVPDDFAVSEAGLIETASTAHFDYVAAEATQHYQAIPDLTEFVRHVLFVRPNYLLMVDNLTAESAHHYRWVSHFGTGVDVAGDWVRGITNNEQILGIGIVNPASVVTNIGDDGRPYVHIEPSEARANERLIHLLYPTDNEGWENRPIFSLPATTDRSVAVRVEQHEAVRGIDDILFTLTDPSTAVQIAQYTFDGRVAVVGQGEDGTVNRLFLHDGRSLFDRTQYRSLISNLSEPTTIEAIFVDETLHVSGTVREMVTLYAPMVSALRFNGLAWPIARNGDYITIYADPARPLQP